MILHSGEFTLVGLVISPIFLYHEPGISQKNIRRHYSRVRLSYTRSSMRSRKNQVLAFRRDEKRKTYMTTCRPRLLTL